MTGIGLRDELRTMDVEPGDDIPKNVSPFVEVGVTGLRRMGGYVDDEFLPNLRGRKAVQIFREMADNSAIAAAWLYTVQQLLRQIEWRVEPASSSPEDRKIAEFVEQNLHDMEHSWGDTLTEICSFLTFGWSCHEMVFKRRQGPWAKDPRNVSKYDDNMVGWRKLPIRAQETLLRWSFAPNGDAMGMVQLAPPRYETKVLPMKKCLLFRTRINKNNPEGYSLLRPMYRSWFMLKRLEEIEAVGAERDLTGLPIAKIPASFLAAKAGTKEAATRDQFKKMVQTVRRNEQEGLVLPSDVDGDTKLPMYDFSLLNSGGSRQFNIDAIIQRYETRMLMSAMADFIMTGHEGSGASYALHTDKSGIFETGMNAIANAIADPFNRKAIPILLSVNNIKPKELPRLEPNKVNPPDLTQLAGFMTAMAGTGMQWFPDPTLEQFLRDAAQLPKLDKNIEQIHEVQQRQQAIISLAQSQLAGLQVQQQAEQGEMQMQQQRMGLLQQGMEMQAGPGGPDPHAEAQAAEQTKQAQLGTQQQAVRVSQEKAKLANLKRQPSRPPTKQASRSPVKKSFAPFGIDHD